MRTFRCSCGNRLFFDTTSCVKCGTRTGMCPVCSSVVPLVGEQNRHRCGNPDCGAELQQCENYRVHNVCNRGVAVADQESLCSYCRLNVIIPDLNADGTREKWARLEAAKRRVLYGVEATGFSIRPPQQPDRPPLSFEFKADVSTVVMTGHDNGRITINIREADDVEREKARKQFQEPQRTLVGHFRHELGHYFWQRIVKPERLSDFRALFGDETAPPYATAQQQYYASGPQSGWSSRFISAYATMHPWEDFAETFACYLDMAAIYQTAVHFDICSGQTDSLKEMLGDYQRIGIIANELNRDRGLLDLVPEVIVPEVADKLRFIHSLRPAA